MADCYDKLWKMPIDHGLIKMELIKAAKSSTNTMVKLRNMEMFERRPWLEYGEY